jgi:preprotein translocase SecE subunit
MAVAVKNSPETASQRPLNRLAVGSLTGTLYVMGSLAIVFYGIPVVWSLLVSSRLPYLQTSFVGLTLLSLLMLGAAAALSFMGVRLIGADPPRGVRAGIFVGIVGVLLIGLIGCVIGGLLEPSMGADSAALGILVTVLITGAILAAGAFAFFRPGFDKWLVQIEEQGWFHATAYKKSQGQRVRRGTILAILVLGGCGVYTLVNHKALERGPASWGYRLPFVYMDQLEAVGAKELEAVGAKELQVAEELVNKEGLSPQRANYVVKNLPQPVKQYVGKQQADELAGKINQLDDRGEDGKPLGKVRVVAQHQLLILLPHVRFTLPMLLAGACLWLGYRVVNYPAFADFLIATEAELNKVSWTTRKRLVQDTIVVLTTVFLLTLFLFLVDVLWFKILSSPWIEVIQTSQSSTGKTTSPEDW